MTEEKQGVPQEEQQPQEAPTEQPVEQIPESYQGKSTTELAKMLQDREKTISRQGDEVRETREQIGQLQNDNAYYRAQGTQGQQANQVQTQQVYPQNPNTGNPAGGTQSEDFDMYDEASAKRFHAQQRQETVAAVDARLNQFAAYNQQTQVGAALNRGRQIIQNNPDYFKGVEEETMTMVSNLARSGNIQPDLIENSTTWFGCADMVKGEKARKDPAQVNPVASTTIDTPAQVKTEESVKLVDESIDDSLVKTFFGGDRELATKSARASAKRGEK